VIDPQLPDNSVRRTSIDKKQQPRRIKPIQRRAQILHALGNVLLAISADFLLNKNKPQQQQRQARKLTTTLIRLGPTFIKIGQTLSTRVDLLPPPYVEALAQLQDRVPSFPTSIAIAIIEQELGQSLGSVYCEFEPKPIAAPTQWRNGSSKSAAPWFG
jgi:predicted unusual protein kinase regulating ubiquinone biosynthesis (AarF/ABC1/UbiB family)